MDKEDWYIYTIECYSSIKKNTFGENKIMEEQVDVEHICLHGYIRNTPSNASACRTPAESQQEDLSSGKEYIEPCKT